MVYNRPKNHYQMMIRTYEQRREALRIKYHKKHRVKNPDYAKAIKKINYKIGLWRKAIRRIEAREVFMKQVAQHIYEFTGHRVVRRDKRHKTSIARKLFYKYCIEAGLRSPMLAFYTGCSKWYATTARRKFTKSFKHSSYNFDMWNRFKEYMKNLKIDYKKTA